MRRTQTLELCNSIISFFVRVIFLLKSLNLCLLAFCVKFLSPAIFQPLQNSVSDSFLPSLLPPKPPSDNLTSLSHTRKQGRKKSHYTNSALYRKKSPTKFHWQETAQTLEMLVGGWKENSLLLQMIKLSLFTFLIFQKEDNFSSVANSGEALAVQLWVQHLRCKETKASREETKNDKRFGKHDQQEVQGNGFV